MKSKQIYLLMLVYLITIFIGCADQGNKSYKETLARIDNKYTITLGDFNNRISKLPPRYQDVINRNKKEFLNELVIDILLYNEALQKKLHRDKDVKEVLEEAKRKIMIARLLKDEVEDKVVINESEIEAYYEENKAKFTMPKVLRASHILVKTEKEAMDILTELSSGRNFEDLARSRSIDPASKAGGDIGYFTRNQLVPEIEEACFNMEVGEISDIVKTKFGYHIIKLTEKREPNIKALSEVHDGIKQSLERFKKKVLFNEFVERLREKAQITINENLLESISKENLEEKSAN